MRKLFLTLVLCLFSLPALAIETADEYDDGIRTIYATACEPLRYGESNSAARMRAADKAAFDALENMNELSDYHSKYDAHDYKVLVYTLVDNYLEDMAVRTLQHNDKQVCVEVTAYLSPQNIEAAAQKMATEREAQYPDSLTIEKAALTEPSPTGMPPKPEIKISQDIAVENTLAEEKPAALIAAPKVDSGKTKVFIEKTKFYNNTDTNAFREDIAAPIEENRQLAITNSLSDADYIIKTKVLRAKVDPINKQTNRMQMVVALELIRTTDSSTLTEHQNRFMLFESTENEQSVAVSLLKKLLRKAAGQILPKIKAKPESYIPSSIITPPEN